jgi:hypothetical protein
MSRTSRRRQITERAGNRCDYCHLAQEHEPFSVFHIEHIIAKQHRSDDSDDNLCLACSSCNLHKGPNIAGIDPDTDDVVPLYHPRQQSWEEHFRWNGAILMGITSCGRATTHVLQINSVESVELRETLIEEGVFPR